MTRTPPTYRALPRFRQSAASDLAATRVDVGHVSLEAVDVRARVEVPRHAHRRTHLCYLARGELRERDRGGWRALSERGLRLSPAGDEHQIRAGAEGFLCLVVSVSDGALDDAASRPPDARRWLAPGPASDIASDLLTELRRADDASPVAADMLAAELLALLGGSPDRPPSSPPRWLARVRERLRDDLRQPPTLAALAREAGVSRAHLARGFRSRYGRTVGEHIRALRVEHARRMITSTDLPLSRIAFEAGFADQSHMTRTLSRFLGFSPGRLRAAAGADAVRRQTAGALADATPVQDAKAHEGRS